MSRRWRELKACTAPKRPKKITKQKTNENISAVQGHKFSVGISGRFHLPQ